MTMKAGAAKHRPASNPPHQPPRACPRKIPSWVAVAPGSTLTSARPSRKCGLVVHCRRSWNSACMTPMIAAPPYAVAPTFRKPVAMSFHVFANDSAIEAYLRPAVERPRLLEHGNGRCDVLERRSGAIEDRDLIRPCP